MKMTFRWDPSLPDNMLKNIAQVPCIKGVVSELKVPVGEVWPLNEIIKLKKLIESHGLEFEVVESVKVHESIKLGLAERDIYIENFCTTLRNLATTGIKVVCYDFMPVFDWLRTGTRMLPDGSTTMVYDEQDLDKVDPFRNEFALSDWEVVFSYEELRHLFAIYKTISIEDMWSNLAYFLRKVVAVAEESNIKLGMHPDDPCWPIYGLPRIITDETNIDRMLAIVDSPYNALTLCSGSLGCNRHNNIATLVRKYGAMNRIAFGHVRNIKFMSEGRDFQETSHYAESGSLDIVDIMRAYHEVKFDGYIRPDHGRMIWGEKGKAGYGFYDRALGAMYLSGIWDAFEKK